MCKAFDLGRGAQLPARSGAAATTRGPQNCIHDKGRGQDARLGRCALPSAHQRKRAEIYRVCTIVADSATDDQTRPLRARWRGAAALEELITGLRLPSRAAAEFGGPPQSECFSATVSTQLRPTVSAQARPPHPKLARTGFYDLLESAKPSSSGRKPSQQAPGNSTIASHHQHLPLPLHQPGPKTWPPQPWKMWHGPHLTRKDDGERRPWRWSAAVRPGASAHRNQKSASKRARWRKLAVCPGSTQDTPDRREKQRGRSWRAPRRT